MDGTPHDPQPEFSSKHPERTIWNKLNRAITPTEREYFNSIVAELRTQTMHALEVSRFPGLHPRADLTQQLDSLNKTAAYFATLIGPSPEDGAV